MLVPATVPAARSRAASAASGAGEELGVERVELGQPVLWNIDRDRPVLRI
jgi:hypothetical protein